MDILAFLPAAVAAAIRLTNERAALPSFKPRWWYRRDRLDARPVAWSLRHRPEEWEWSSQPHTIRHIPSNHVFWVSNGWGFYALYAADCSCTSSRGKFQVFQQGVFGRAFKRWRRRQRPTVDAEQFTSHFVR